MGQTATKKRRKSEQSGLGSDLLYEAVPFNYFYCGASNCVDPLDPAISDAEKRERIIAVYHQFGHFKAMAVRLLQGELLVDVLADRWRQSPHAIKPDPKKARHLSYTYRYRGSLTRISPEGLEDGSANDRVMAIFHQYGYYQEHAIKILASSGLTIPDEQIKLLQQPDFGFFVDVDDHWDETAAVSLKPR